MVELYYHSISLCQIDLIEVKEVVWLDGSLGCPQPGMEYANVLTATFRSDLKRKGGFTNIILIQGKRFFYVILPLNARDESKDLDKNVDEGWLN